MRSGSFRTLTLFLIAILILCGMASVSADSVEDVFDYRITDDGSAVITGYKGSAKELVFPETIEGHTVTALGASFSANTVSVKTISSIAIPAVMTAVEPGALQFAEYLTEMIVADDNPVMSFRDGVLYDREKESIVLYLQSNAASDFEIPEGIREIGDKAFYRSKLVSVRFPGSVERIGSESFNQCIRLSEVSLSEGLKSIDKEAFTNCDRLKRIEIPASVTDIAESVFTDSHLKEILVAPGSEVFSVSDGALINERDGVLIAFPHSSGAETCTIPEGVKRIGSFAFYRSHNLKQVNFPDGLLEIGHGAFVSCNHLTELNLPDSIVRLEEASFGCNSDVEKLHIPAGLTEIVNNFNDMAVSELEIPENVTTIKESFCSLRNLTEAVIPAGVKTIGRGAFAFCRNLAGITIPGSVTEFDCTFIGCAGTLLIRTDPGSCVERYCTGHHMRYEYISEKEGN